MRKCPGCKTPNPSHARYCLWCGLRIRTTTRRLQYFRLYVPPHAAPQPNRTPPTSNRDRLKWVWGTLMGLVMAIGVIVTSVNNVVPREDSQSHTAMLAPSLPLPPLSSTPPPAPEPGLNAFVQLSGTQFIVTNLDSYDWLNVKMEVNGGSPSAGYSVARPVFKAGKVYRIEAMQFFDPDGNQFKFQIKPRRFSICADTPNGFTCFVGKLESKDWIEQ